MCRLAAELEEDGQLAAAAEMYRAAMAAAGPKAEICFQVAELLYRLGDLGGARERYYMAIELDEDYVEARANLGCVLAETGQRELAVAAFEGALRYHPDYADVHYHLARTLDEMDQPRARPRSIGGRSWPRRRTAPGPRRPAGDWPSHIVTGWGSARRSVHAAIHRSGSTLPLPSVRGTTVAACDCRGVANSHRPCILKIMQEILFDYKLNPTTWAYISALMMIGIYFKFHRFWSVRNLDLVALIAFSPGFLLLSRAVGQWPD